MTDKLAEAIRRAAPAIVATYQAEEKRLRRRPHPDETVIAVVKSARRLLDGATASPAPFAARLRLPVKQTADMAVAGSIAMDDDDSVDAYSGHDIAEACLFVVDVLGNRGLGYESEDAIDREILNRLAVESDANKLAARKLAGTTRLSLDKIATRSLDRSMRVLLALRDRMPVVFADVQVMPQYVRCVVSRGKEYFRFRRPGLELPLPGTPGTAGWQSAYHDARRRYVGGLRNVVHNLSTPAKTSAPCRDFAPATLLELAA